MKTWALLSSLVDFQNLLIWEEILWSNWNNGRKLADFRTIYRFFHTYVAIVLSRSHLTEKHALRVPPYLFGVESIIFSLAILTRRPLLEALGGSSPKSFISQDAQSVTCVCRMTEKNGRACSSTETFRIEIFTPLFFPFPISIL